MKALWTKNSQLQQREWGFEYFDFRTNDKNRWVKNAKAFSLSTSTTLFVVLIMLICSGSATQIKDFHSIWPWNYISDGLYEVDIGIQSATDSVGVSLYDGLTIIGLGDVDDNKHTDIITVSEDRRYLTIHYYNKDNMDYSSSKTLDMGTCKVGAANVIPTKKYKIAVLCTENPDYEHISILADVNSDNNEALALDYFQLYKGSQPLFIDVNGDSYTDILFSPPSTDATKNIRVALFNTKTETFNSDTEPFFDNYVIETNGCQSIPNKEELHLTVPNYSSILDMNSDCIADVYLTATDPANSFIYGMTMIAVKYSTDTTQSLKYCMISSENLAINKLISPVFADFDNNAAIDKAYYDTVNNAIQIFYNIRGANSASDSSLWKSMPEVNINTQTDYFKNYVLFSSTPDISPIENASSLYTESKYFSMIPGQLRVGDLDTDGYPDIITTIVTPSGGSKTIVLINSACADNPSKTTNCSKRYLEISSEYSLINNYESTSYGIFLDFDDNGREDFIIVYQDATGKAAIVTFYNNYSKDSYYISSSVYTAGSGNFGSHVYGVCVRGIYTTLSDSKYPFVANQITRTSFGALEPPNAVYVIGRSNNYIEDFTLTYYIQEYGANNEPTGLKVQQTSWSPIIPNSNLFIGIYDGYSTKWAIQLLINPTDSFLLVGMVLTIILIVIGIVIIYIHMKEKKEDEESRNPQLDFF